MRLSKGEDHKNFASFQYLVSGFKDKTKQNKTDLYEFCVYRGQGTCTHMTHAHMTHAHVHASMHAFVHGLLH